MTLKKKTNWTKIHKIENQSVRDLTIFSGPMSLTDNIVYQEKSKQSLHYQENYIYTIITISPLTSLIKRLLQ